MKKKKLEHAKKEFENEVDNNESTSFIERCIKKPIIPIVISLFILLPTILFFISGNFEINMNSTIPTLIQLLAHCDVSTL